LERVRYKERMSRNMNEGEMRDGAEE